MATELDRLAASRYVLLTTFRKDGRAVPTPVWAARDGQDLVIWTAANTGKIKRLRNNGTVEVSPCDPVWPRFRLGQTVNKLNRLGSTSELAPRSPQSLVTRGVTPRGTP
ncbi:MAG TPA: PPOX class F420-dependent oxidoreductase [Pseudonocardiaceae bacterium]